MIRPWSFGNLRGRTGPLAGCVSIDGHSPAGPFFIGSRHRTARAERAVSLATEPSLTAGAPVLDRSGGGRSAEKAPE